MRLSLTCFLTRINFLSEGFPPGTTSLNNLSFLYKSLKSCRVPQLISFGYTSFIIATFFRILSQIRYLTHFLTDKFHFIFILEFLNRFCLPALITKIYLIYIKLNIIKNVFKLYSSTFLAPFGIKN